MQIMVVGKIKYEQLRFLINTNNGSDYTKIHNEQLTLALQHNVCTCTTSRRAGCVVEFIEKRSDIRRTLGRKWQRIWSSTRLCIGRRASQLI